MYIYTRHECDDPVYAYLCMYVSVQSVWGKSDAINGLCPSPSDAGPFTAHGIHLDIHNFILPIRTRIIRIPALNSTVRRDTQVHLYDTCRAYYLLARSREVRIQNERSDSHLYAVGIYIHIRAHTRAAREFFE